MIHNRTELRKLAQNIATRVITRCDLRASVERCMIEEVELVIMEYRLYASKSLIEEVELVIMESRLYASKSVDQAPKHPGHPPAGHHG